MTKAKRSITFLLACLALLPGDLTYLDTDNTVVSTTNSLNFPESGWWGTLDLDTID